MDTSLLLSEDDALLFGSYIGILQWAVELARIDLTQLVLLMARFQNAPHEGHMAAVLCIFGYVKGHLKAKIVFDLLYCDWMAINWQDNVDWKESIWMHRNQFPQRLQSYWEMKFRSTSIVMLHMQCVLLHNNQRQALLLT